MRYNTLVFAACSIIWLSEAWGCNDSSIADDGSANQPAQHGSGLLAARQITHAADLIGGTDPVGGLGDWYLANDRIEIIIDDVANQNGLAPGGGTLVDVAVRGKDNDQFNQMYQVFLLSQNLAFLYESIRASVDDTLGVAQIVVEGHLSNANPPDPATAPPGAITTAVAEQIRVRTEYTLYDGDPVLHITSSLTNRSTIVLNSAFGAPMSDILLWGKRSMLPFVPYVMRGFDQPPLDVGDPAGAVGVYAFIAAHSDVDPAVSYGVVAPSSPDGFITGVNTDQISGVGQPLLSPPVRPGDTITYTRHLLIAEERNVQAIADQAYRMLAAEAPHVLGNRGLGTLQGELVAVPPGRMITIVAEQTSQTNLTTPRNAITLQQPGPFALTLPEGTYRLRILSGRSEPIMLGPIDVRANTITAAPAIPISPLARVSFTIRDHGMPIPARLTIKGIAPTRDPILGPLHTGRISGNVAYSLDGTGTVALEPGDYDVYASRGMTYSLAHARIHLNADDTVPLDMQITQVVDTTGYVGGDFHVHSGASFDSSLDVVSRVISFAAEGVDLLVSTEHDYIIDYAPTIRTLGLQGVLTSMIGVESTGVVPTAFNPFTIGHNNAWPLVPVPNAPRAGALRDERIEPGELYERIRAIAPTATPVIQLNHPRAEAVGSVGLGYFTNMHFNPRVPIPDQDDHGINSFLRRKSPVGGTDNLAFDAIEVLNGAGWEAIVYNQQNRDDWFALLRQGIIRTGMGNSDSHRLFEEPAGSPRTFVRYTVDRSGTRLTIDSHTFNQAILQQHAVVSNGPFIEAFVHASAHGADISTQGSPAYAGDRWTMQPADDRVIVHVRVQAAPWIPVTEIRIVVNGQVVQRLGGTQGVNTTAQADPFGTAGVLRFAGDIDVPITRDSFIVIEAGLPLPVARDLDTDGVLETWDTDGDGDADQVDADRGGLPPRAAPALADAIIPGLLPWGFTNPIFVDRDGNGWEAPGL